MYVMLDAFAVLPVSIIILIMMRYHTGRCLSGNYSVSSLTHFTLCAQFRLPSQLRLDGHSILGLDNSRHCLFSLAWYRPFAKHVPCREYQSLCNLVCSCCSPWGLTPSETMRHI